MILYIGFVAFAFTSLIMRIKQLKKRLWPGRAACSRRRARGAIARRPAAAHNRRAGERARRLPRALPGPAEHSPWT
jgi:hypothetical protein